MKLFDTIFDQFYLTFVKVPHVAESLVDDLGHTGIGVAGPLNLLSLYVDFARALPTMLVEAAI